MMINSRKPWTEYLNNFNNVDARWCSQKRRWEVYATAFAIEGIQREGYFVCTQVWGNYYRLNRTNKAHQSRFETGKEENR